MPVASQTALCLSTEAPRLVPGHPGVGLSCLRRSWRAGSSALAPCSQAPTQTHLCDGGVGGWPGKEAEGLMQTARESGHRSGAYASLAQEQGSGLLKLPRTVRGQGCLLAAHVSEAPAASWRGTPLFRPPPQAQLPSGLCPRGGGEHGPPGTDASPLAPSSLPSGGLQPALQVFLLILKRGVTVFLGGGCRHGERGGHWPPGGPSASPFCSPLGGTFRSETTAQYRASSCW